MGALTLFAADKLSKLRELRREAAVDPAASRSPGRARELRARRLRHYQRSLALLEERLAESPLVTALRDELGSLQRERAILAFTPSADRTSDSERVVATSRRCRPPARELIGHPGVASIAAGGRETLPVWTGGPLAWLVGERRLQR